MDAPTPEDRLRVSLVRIIDGLKADNAALRAALSRLAACAFGPPGELLAAADAAREILGE